MNKKKRSIKKFSFIISCVLSVNDYIIIYYNILRPVHWPSG